MQTKLIIIYSSVNGQTPKTCSTHTKQFKEHNQPVDLFSINDFHGGLNNHGAIVIGSSIRYDANNHKTTDWKSVLAEVFPSRIDYKCHSFFDQKMIQPIIQTLHGSSNKNINIKHTQWSRIHAFGEKPLTL